MGDAHDDLNEMSSVHCFIKVLDWFFRLFAISSDGLFFLYLVSTKEVEVLYIGKWTEFLVNELDVFAELLEQWPFDPRVILIGDQMCVYVLDLGVVFVYELTNCIVL